MAEAGRLIVQLMHSFVDALTVLLVAGVQITGVLSGPRHPAVTHSHQRILYTTHAVYTPQTWAIRFVILPVPGFD